MWKEWEEHFGQLTEKTLEFGIFSKDEPTTKYTLNRLICSPHDVAKVYFGPVIGAVEEQLYKSKWFIKKVPVPLRPRFILNMRDRLGLGAQMTDSDFTSFECSFTIQMKEACELILMKHMLSSLDSSGEWFSDFKEWVCSAPVLKNKFFRIVMDDVARFSGESTTSAFNGFTNVMVHEFIAHKTKQKVEFCVEGDDCLAFWEKETPEEHWYSDLGFSIKLGKHQEVETTSFCGQVFSPVDMKVLTDPHYVLAGTGWISNRYIHARHSVKMGLLRAKAWSVAYQYQGCPILSSMAKYLLRVTKSFDAKKALDHLDIYKRQQLQDAMDNFNPTKDIWVPVGVDSRLLVEKLYGITTQQQIQYEMYFDNQLELQPFPDYLTTWPASWPQVWDDYVKLTADNPWLTNHPPEIWFPSYPTEVALPIKARDKRLQPYIDSRIKVVRFPVI